MVDEWKTISCYLACSYVDLFLSKIYMPLANNLYIQGKLNQKCTFPVKRKFIFKILVTHDDVWKFVNMAEGMTEDTRESERKFLF
jgi:hypothetical protein